MSTYNQFRTCTKEVVMTIIHDDGRKTIYTRDYAGREFFSLFGRRGNYEGTHPLNRVPAAAKPKPEDRY